MLLFYDDDDDDEKILHVVFMSMTIRFCIVCVFFITLPAYVILGSLNTGIPLVAPSGLSLIS